MELINKNLLNLKIIKEDLSFFFERLEKKKIEQIELIISIINNTKICDFERIWKKISLEIIKEYKEKAEERRKKKESIFFKAIYNYHKIIEKLGEKEIIENVENQFANLKTIFSKKGINSLDIKIKTICLDSIKGKTVDIIGKEIDTLKQIFKIDIVNNREELIEKIILLTKRDEIYNLLESLKKFIEYSKSKKTNFTELILQLIFSIKTSYNEDSIIKAKKILNKVRVDINIILEEKKIKNSYLDILNMLINTPDSISFLLKITLIDCQFLREKVGEDENIILEPNQIEDLEKCVIFMNSLKEKQNINEISDYDLIKSFIKKLQDSNEDLTTRFKSYTDNFFEITKLFDSILDRSESARQKIIFTCKNSYITLRNTKNNYFDGNYIEEFKIEKN